jgi:hypothetical protein
MNAVIAPNRQRTLRLSETGWDSNNSTTARRFRTKSDLPGMSIYMGGRSLKPLNKIV